MLRLAETVSVIKLTTGVDWIFCAPRICDFRYLLVFLRTAVLTRNLGVQ